MRAKGITRKVEKARDAAMKAMYAHVDRSNKYSVGFASESYISGYHDALCDVLLVLYGVTPNRNDYWPKDEVSE